MPEIVLSAAEGERHVPELGGKLGLIMYVCAPHITFFKFLVL